MITLSAIESAARLLKGKVVRTPLVHSLTFSTMSGTQVYLKLENLQETGSFKLRGATHTIETRKDRIGVQGVVAASAGNHAQGVALAARRAGLPATIVMPQWASITKQEATRSYGGELILEGQSIEESLRKARELSEMGKTFVHPFDDPAVICGQGTIALEVLEDLPDPDVMIVPIGGGGLISGIATAAKALRPQVRIIGVQTAACPSAYWACREGKVRRVEASRSIADGIAVKQIGELTFSILRTLVDEVVLVEEHEISAAMLLLLERKRMLAEGAGATPLAALFSKSLDLPKGSKVVLIISGGNVDSPLLGRIIRQGLFRNGRILRFSVCLDDVPGALMHLLTFIAGLSANVLHITHDRAGRDLPIYLSRVDIELETRGPGHIHEIIQALHRAGYRIESPSRSPFSLE